MVLRVGDKGEPVKMLQRHLNKLGSLLLVDGDFGAATRDAIPDARTVLAMPGGPDADDALQQALAAFPDPCPPLTSAGVTFIARFEVGSPAEYRRQYCHPTWPSAKSCGVRRPWPRSAPPPSGWPAWGSTTSPTSTSRSLTPRK